MSKSLVRTIESTISAKQLERYTAWKKFNVLETEVPIWVAYASIPLRNKNQSDTFHFYFVAASWTSLQKAKSLLLTQVRDFLVENDDLGLS